MFRETTISFAGTERVIRTERIGTIRQLETEHTKAVKAAILEMRMAAAPDSMPRAMAEGQAKRVTRVPKCNWSAITRVSRPRATDPTMYMVRAEPGHYVESVDLLT